MKAFALSKLIDRRADDSAEYLEFVRNASMSVGLYVLPVGGTDGQSPHTEDEVYVVLGGHSRFTAGELTRNVASGDTLFVPAGVPHHFHDITDELRLIVVFAPPEGSTPGPATDLDPQGTA